MEQKRTTISIYAETRKKIDEMKYRDNESYDSVIMRLLSIMEHMKTIK